MRAAARASSSRDHPAISESEEEPGPTEADADEFKNHVANLYLRNKMSAEQTALLVRKAKKAGASGVDAMVKATGKSIDLKNAQRGLMRCLLKDSKAPEPYWAEIPCSMEAGSKVKKMVMLPFLLMHEMLAAFVPKMNVAEISEFEDFGMEAKRRQFCADNGIPMEMMIPIGLHGDGVPHQKHRTVEVFSWNICSQPMWERYLFTCLEKIFLCGCGCSGRCSIDAIFEIFVWSLRMALIGMWPSCRHDRTEWSASDKSRKRKTGNLGFYAALFQVRGDWAWYKQVFSFKGWAATSICWRCWANRSDLPFDDFTKKALWRQRRHMTLDVLMKRLRSEGSQPSALFGAPGFLLEYITIDVLHAFDLGVSLNALGNLFWSTLGILFKGPTIASRVALLWERLKRYYREYKPPNKLQKLTVEMIKQDKKGPKLRAKGGECRGVIAFGVELAQEMDETLNSTWSKTLLGCFSALLDCYQCMGHRPFESSVCADSCRRFLMLYKSMRNNASDERLWKVSPKFHMVQELCEYMTEEIGNPSNFWAYRDESFVGFIAEVGMSRGGRNNAETTPGRVMKRYRALCTDK